MLTSGALLASAGVAAPTLHYSLALRPPKLVLGEPVTAVLSCAATAGSVEAIAFDDSSLLLSLVAVPRRGEPVQAFPNRAVGEAGSVQVHLQTTGRRRLRRGQVMTRELDLLRLWPRWILDVGRFEISYRLGPDARPWVAGPATLAIESGPTAVPRLLALLEHSDMAVRARAAGLLHRMTSHVAGYSAEGDPGERGAAIDRWRTWWRDAGSKIPWTFVSDAGLGGLAYARRSLQPREADALSTALDAWLQNRDAGPAALRGKERAADDDFEYPPEPVLLAGDERIVRMLDFAVRQLPDRSASAPLVLATVAKMPDRQLVQSLAALEHAALSSPRLRVSGAFAAGLLDILDVERIPAGSQAPDRR
jgi:hypothetical protein